MSFVDSIKTCLAKYATFGGRASRPEFWWFILFQFLLSLVVGFISPILAGLVSLALLLPMLAAQSRRLHDVGKSGWMMLIGLIPLIGWLIILYWSVLAGETGANDYGAPPAAA